MAQLKDKKITIMEQKTIMNANGIPTKKLVPIAGGENIWAYYRQTSAEEFFAAAWVNYKVEAVFKINWRNDLKNSMIIVFRGTQYQITRIDDFEGNKEDITIYAYSINPDDKKK